MHRTMPQEPDPIMKVNPLGRQAFLLLSCQGSPLEVHTSMPRTCCRRSLEEQTSLQQQLRFLTKVICFASYRSVSFDERHAVAKLSGGERIDESPGPAGPRPTGLMSRDLQRIAEQLDAGMSKFNLLLYPQARTTQ